MANKVQINVEEVGRRPGLPTDLPEWRLAMRCRGCGRWLTDPRSVALGIGPSCATRETG
ncbi:DUF6011 domain-containing protein [Mycolicibacter arupensis]|jgi:hypothetical protein|uniref:DUF6011 domain-containing protein n=1 Tax=Mycolicibacter arupensis TaxID=342002 RepID=UPI000A6153C9|nr:DUF6011 domain-containing protein [Mycolicibacter arupensis]